MSDIGKNTRDFQENVERADKWVNGDKNTFYEAKGGEKVPSIKNLNERAQVNIDDARKYAVEAENEANRSSSEADRAESAATAAQIGAELYPNVSTGLSSVAEKKYFNVVATDDNFVDLYQKVDGKAVFIKSYPSSEYVVSRDKAVRRDISMRYARINNADIEDVLFAVTDELGNRTWIEANSEDGGMTDLSQLYLENKIGVNFKYFKKSDLNLLVAVTDDSGVVTDLCVDNNGNFPDFVIKNIASRIGVGFEYGMAVFGSSTFQEMHPSFLSVFEDTNVSNVFLGGDSGARIDSISARIGALSPSAIFSTNIVEGGSKFTANWENDPAMMNWKATLSNGAKGIISYENASYFFNPENITNELIIDSEDDYNIVPDDVLNQSVFVINAGKNNLTNSNASINSAEYVFNRTVEITDFLTKKDKLFIVLGHFVNTNQGVDASKRVNDANALLKSKYGLLYFDLGAYLCSDEVWIDTEITPTSEDIQYQEKGQLAPSLSRNSGHMNQTTSRAACVKIKEQLLNLEYVKGK